MRSLGVEMSIVSKGLTAVHTHGPSGSQVKTVPPADNGGDGSSFSPTDLLATSLGACALTTMALQAAREGLTWGDARVGVIKIMGGPPRRVETLQLTFALPAMIRPEHRARIEEIARGCPVARSLHPDLKVSMTFHYS